MMQHEFQACYQSRFSAKQRSNVAAFASWFQIIFDKIIHGFAQKTLHFGLCKLSSSASTFQVDIEIPS